MPECFSTVIFDLDGTLLRSERGILNAFRYAAGKLGRALPEGLDERGLIGPPLHASFSRLLQVDEADLERAVALFREYYGPTGAYESELYPGAFDLVRGLHTAGRRVCLATSKYSVMAQKILEHFGLTPYIACAAMSDGTERTSGKAAMIASVLERTGSSASGAVMIGDTLFDAQGAQQAGTGFIGVLYGYGTRQEMAAAGAERFAESVPELRSLLLA